MRRTADSLVRARLTPPPRTSGSIPKEIGSLFGLESLELWGNQLTGKWLALGVLGHAAARPHPTVRASPQA